MSILFSSLTSEIRTNQSSLTIPRNALKPGLYIFQLSCAFPAMEASTKYIVYLKIQRPPLVVIIAGGNARSVAWNKPFTLDASVTKDPVTGSSDELEYEWYCRWKERSNIGGCFGYGEKLSEFTDKKKVQFREKLLYEKSTYQFTVTVSTEKWGYTSGSYTQEIRAIPGNPPEISLR